MVDKYKFNESTSDNKLFGIYSTGPLRFVPVNLDVYWLRADNAGVTFNSTPGRERRQTLGARTWGKIGQTHLDFEMEGAGQFGTVGRGDVAAGMFTTNLGYTLPFRACLPVSTSSSTMRAETASPAAASAPSTSSAPAPASPSTQSTTSRSPSSSISSGARPIAMRSTTSPEPSSGRAPAPRPATSARRSICSPPITSRVHLLGSAGYSHFFPGEFIRKTGRRVPTYVFPGAPCACQRADGVWISGVVTH